VAGSGICWWTPRVWWSKPRRAQREGPRPRRHPSAARTGSFTSAAAFVAVGGRVLYRGRGKDWVEQALGVEVEVVNRSPKPPPQKVLEIWAREWFKEGHQMDLGKLPTRPGFENLPRRWVAERTFAWISHNRRMARDFERMCSTGEAFIHAAMTRLIVRRLARA
jgi:hypothetical protein